MKSKLITSILLVLFFQLSFYKYSCSGEISITNSSNVYERKFFDLLNDPYFVPLGDDIAVIQFYKADRNGEPIRKKRIGVVDLQGFFLFFANRHVSNPQDYSRAKQALADFHSKNRGYSELTNSAHSSLLISKRVKCADQSTVNWVKALIYHAPAGYNSANGPLEYRQDGILIDYRRFYPIESHYLPTTYYANPLVLDKVDKDGNVLWQKVYLYFDPWWAHEQERTLVTAYDADTYSFYYYKIAEIAALSEDNIFVYFGGSPKIFRLDSKGIPHTADDRLIVMDYREYVDIVTELILKLHAMKERSGINVDVEPCNIEMSSKGKFYTIGGYDHIGESLSKVFIHSSKYAHTIRRSMMEHKGISECMANYHSLSKSIK